MHHESLEFRIAENRLQHLEQEMDPILAAHEEANLCLECEKRIRYSIDVYRWISRAEESALIADREGLEEFTQPQYHDLKLVYERWLVLGETIERLAETVTERGYVVENLAEFLRCHEAVQDWLARNEYYEQSKAARDERFAEEPW